MRTGRLLRFEQTTTDARNLCLFTTSTPSTSPEKDHTRQGLCVSYRSGLPRWVTFARVSDVPCMSIVTTTSSSPPVGTQTASRLSCRNDEEMHSRNGATSSMPTPHPALIHCRSRAVHPAHLSSFLSPGAWCIEDVRDVRGLRGSTARNRSAARWSAVANRSLEGCCNEAQIDACPLPGGTTPC